MILVLLLTAWGSFLGRVLARSRPAASRGSCPLASGWHLMRSGQSILRAVLIPAEGCGPVLAKGCLLRRDDCSSAQILRPQEGVRASCDESIMATSKGTSLLGRMQNMGTKKEFGVPAYPQWIGPGPCLAGRVEPRGGQGSCGRRCARTAPPWCLRSRTAGGATWGTPRTHSGLRQGR